jgi:hypothetical protein
MRHNKNGIKGISTTARQGFLANLLKQVEQKGAVKVSLKQGGAITPAQLHAWAVAHGMAYIGEILAVDNRQRRPLT